MILAFITKKSVSFSCAHSPVYKIRIMAARALHPLVAKGDITESLMMLVDSLPKNHQEMSQNATHGLLLQVIRDCNLIFCTLNENHQFINIRVFSPEAGCRCRFTKEQNII